jgi:RNA polymerase sigma factor (sigma-70 family)
MGAAGDLSDADLLELFASRRGEASELAFGVLLDRHGAMVHRVCMAVLRDHHDAQDAFQATFLVLARRAGLLRAQGSLGPWLHQVAYRTASCARSVAARRRRHEGLAAQQTPHSADGDQPHDLGAVIHEEIGRLPLRYHQAVVLCLLEGLTPEQAARQVGCPDGTLHSRLARGRAQLRTRLAQRGVTPSLLFLGLAASTEAATGSASVPTTLAASTVRAAIRVAAGESIQEVVSMFVGRFVQGVLRAMFLERLRMAMFALVAGLILATGVGVLGGRAGGASSARGVNFPTGSGTTGREAPVPAHAALDEPSGAQRLALSAHEQAAAFGKLPRFSYQVRYRCGIVDSMRVVDATVDRLKQSLTAPVIEKDWIGWYQTAFSWDERHFLWEMSPGDTKLNYDARFWTKVGAWERHEANDSSSVNFVRTAGPKQLWPYLDFFEYSYLRLTPHRYWWGRTMGVNGQTMSPVPPERATWRQLGVERFGDEECDLVDSPERGQRLWIGRDSRRVRGALTYWFGEDQPSKGFYTSESVRRIAGRAFESQFDYVNWRRQEASEDQLLEVAVASAGLRSGTDPSRIQPNELVRFDDYREIAPGVWLPFRETRAFPHASETVQGKQLLNRSELRVYRVATDVDLSDRIARLMPREGDTIENR